MTDEVKPDWERHIASLTGLGGELTRDLWRKLRAVCPTLTQPTQAGTFESSVEFVWGDTKYHLEIDIFDDGTIEWFGLNRKNNETASETDSTAELDDSFRRCAAHWGQRRHTDP